MDENKNNIGLEEYKKEIYKILEKTNSKPYEITSLMELLSSRNLRMLDEWIRLRSGGSNNAFVKYSRTGDIEIESFSN